MAMKLIKRFPLLGHLGIKRYPFVEPVYSTRLLSNSSVEQPLRVPFLYTSASACIRTQGCGRRSLSIVIRESSFVSSRSVGSHGDSVPQLCLSKLHKPTAAEEQDFQQRLKSCSSSQQVLTLLSSVEIMSDTMAAAALHCVADLEQQDRALKDPTLLEKHTIRELFFQLERDSKQLTDAGLVSALWACTRLFVDPWCTLMVRLVCESQERLDNGRMSVGQLSTLGQAMLAIEGPDCVMMEPILKQIQRKNPAKWSLEVLIDVYRLVQGSVREKDKYRGLLYAMNTNVLKVTSSMDPPTVSRMFSVLVTLNEFNIMPLVINLCKQATQHVPHFTDEELTVVLGALIHFGHSDHYFVEAMEKYVPTVALTSHPETITKVCQFFGRRNILSQSVFDAIMESFVLRADEYNTSQVARQIIALGKLGYLPPNAGNVFRKVETILQSHFAHFRPRTLLNLLHSCTLVERFPVNFVDKVLSTYFFQRLEDRGTGLDRLVLAKLTQLNMTMKLECPFYQGPELHPKYRVKCFLSPGISLETPVDFALHKSVKRGLVRLLGSCIYLQSEVLTPYYYTLDMEIKLDKDGCVLPANNVDDVHKRIALCIHGEKRFTTNKRQLLGKEAIKERHLRLLGYEVVQIPYYEFDNLKSSVSMMEYLHQKIFPHTNRLN